MRASCVHGQLQRRPCNVMYAQLVSRARRLLFVGNSSGCVLDRLGNVLHGLDDGGFDLFDLSLDFRGGFLGRSFCLCGFLVLNPREFGCLGDERVALFGGHGLHGGFKRAFAHVLRRVVGLAAELFVELATLIEGDLALLDELVDNLFALLARIGCSTCLPPTLGSYALRNQCAFLSRTMMNVITRIRNAQFPYSLRTRRRNRVV